MRGHASRFGAHLAASCIFVAAVAGEAELFVTNDMARVSTPLSHLCLAACSSNLVLVGGETREK